MEGVKNIRKIFHQADEIDRREGMAAYSNYHHSFRKICKFFDFEFEPFVGAFAALSPNNDYLNNLRSAVTIALGHREGIALERITVSTYKTCASRAWRVLDGEDFLAFTKGQKTRSFYQNILDPNDPAPVTIDGHMISIFKGKRMRMNEAVRFNKHYELISDAIKLVAYDERLLANQVQAILWFTWKRIHKPVKGDGQLNLYDQQDHWQVMHSPELIEPYPFL